MATSESGQAAFQQFAPKAEIPLTTQLLPFPHPVSGGVTDIVYLAPKEAMPDVGDEGRWLFVEALDGKFYGTGESWKATGEWVGYGSLAEDDISLEAALTAAEGWAFKYDVPTIWVQLSP